MADTTITKIKSSKVAAFMNTGTSSAPVWSRFGKGISSLPISYGAKTSSETYIDEDNATTTVDGYEVSMDTEQTAMKGEPIFNFVDDIRNELKTGSDCETDVILANIYDMTATSGTYSGDAQSFKATVAVTDFELNGGEIAKIKYKVSLNGTPTDVKVSIAADGKVTVTTTTTQAGSGS
ncbi:MAG: phage tail tube protein [Acutalibacteraceae bacterium]